MPAGVITKLRWRANRGKIVVISVLALAVVMIISGFAGDIARALLYRTPSEPFILGAAAPIYQGPASLEERILESDVVARVRLLSMSSTVEALGDEWGGVTTYVSALEFRFEALEYLKGDGGGEIVGIAYGNDYYESRLGALLFGEGITDTHDMAWDDREAIVFLRKGRRVLSALEEPNRYALGFAGSYTIDSRHSKRWLPAAYAEGVSAAQSVGSVEGGQRFLTGAERAEGESREDVVDYQVANNAHNRALGAGGDSSTITLSRLNALITELQAEIDAGDGSDEYMQCVVEKYRWYREVEHLYATTNYAYRPEIHEHEIVSGSPANTVFAYGPESLYPNFNSADIYVNNLEWEGWLEGKDAHYFQVVDDKALVGNARPLPEGEYILYYNSRDAKYILCDAYPDALRTWKELVVDVIAPEDAIHEVFFDPVDIGGAVGADGMNGVLQPERFEDDDGGETAIERIEWRDGQAEMTLSPPTDLADFRIDFIALDGTASLRLAFNDAIELADADGISTLAWGVCEQPWQSGDLLMLRIAEGIPNDGAQATNDVECIGAATTAPE